MRHLRSRALRLPQENVSFLVSGGPIEHRSPQFAWKPCHFLLSFVIKSVYTGDAEPVDFLEKLLQFQLRKSIVV